MSSQYDPVAARSLATITKRGAPVTFSRGGGGGTYDPLTDTWSGGASASAAGFAVQAKPSLADQQRFIAQSLTLVEPITLLVAASGLSFEPKPGDTMTWAGKSYVVKDVDPTAPDGTPILYGVTGSQ